MEWPIEAVRLSLDVELFTHDRQDIHDIFLAELG